MIMPQTLSSHLSLLASQAAIQLDNLLRDPTYRMDAVRLLAEFLESSFTESHGIRRTLIDPTTETVFGQALTHYDHSIKTIDQLFQMTAEIAGKLRGVDKGLYDEDVVRRLRAFCAALSKYAASPNESYSRWQESRVAGKLPCF